MYERGELVGIVSELNRYPVKSMQGESLQVAPLTLKGIEGDRQHAFVKTAVSTDGFPWLTARDYPEMVLFRPTYNLDIKATQVVLPDGRTLRLESKELCQILQEGATRSPKIHLMKLKRGAYDGFPVSLMGVQTIRAVSSRSSVEEDSRRYRPNVVVETIIQKEGAEDTWLGGVVTFGEREDSPQILIVQLDPRCMMINIDPKTGKQTPSVLGDVVRNRRKEMGVYANVVKAGEMRVGEPIYLLRPR